MKVILNNKHLSHQSHHSFAQSGFSSLLFVVLVGMSLTALSVGYLSTTRSMQSSAITVHAQTQAQMNAMVGVQAVSRFLKTMNQNELNKTVKGKVTDSSGEIVNTYTKVAACTLENQYCYDIEGKSGGATSIIRAQYNFAKEIKPQSVAGTIFAGGLVVGGSATFKGEEGDDVTIFVGGSNAGKVTNTAGKEVALDHIDVQEFNGNLEVATATMLRSSANYIFTRNSAGAIACFRNNLNVSGTNITVETAITCPSQGVTLNSGIWTFDSSKANLAGVIWFDGDVKLQLNSTPSDYVNSVLAVGSVTTELSKGNSAGAYNIYAPLHYLLTATNSQIKSRLEKVCPQDNYPIQYCKPYSLSDRNLLTSIDFFYNNRDKYLNNIDAFPANLANILFLTDASFAIDAANKTEMNLFGNILGTQGAGGTGKASGKITGTGNINIKGNLVVTGTLTTEVQGNMTITLGKSNSSGNNIPSIKSVLKAGAIRYM
ncbi:hypothetical protein [Acinetobacter sp. Marseille-Q1618]|uniref:hypothetical protein n=1 Tax=Acinetobacter sp. Marseille-Q1618 TaxID=2697502 RepID=UPI00156DBA65|nr:hypothetical protein [Acinetobacter sp. Marseille-Q1618]